MSRRNRHPFEGDLAREQRAGRFCIWMGGSPGERVPTGVLPTKMLKVIARAPELTVAKRMVRRVTGVWLRGLGWKNARRVDGSWWMITEV